MQVTTWRWLSQRACDTCISAYSGATGGETEPTGALVDVRLGTPNSEQMEITSFQRRRTYIPPEHPIVPYRHFIFDTMLAWRGVGQTVTSQLETRQGKAIISAFR